MNERKISQNIFDTEQDNLQKLAELFPAVVKDGQVDFDALKEELGTFEEVSSEKYELTWAGKQNAKKIAQTDVAGRTLKFVPEDSKDADTTENLYIEGDNLEVLKLLRQNYYGAIKMIYIDPPYNTGNDFVYRDNFIQAKAESDEAEGEIVEGERMTVNQKSSNRFHADWLNMMYPRLRVAKDLLRDDGVIFISIDDNEVAQLRKACDEIFGAVNFVANLKILSNPRGRQSSNHFATAGEYIFVYSKNINKLKILGDIPSKEQIATYNKQDSVGKFRDLGLRKRGSDSRKEDSPTLFFPIYYCPITNDISLERKNGHIEIIPKLEDGSDGRWRWSPAKIEKDKHLLYCRLVSRDGKQAYDVFQKDYFSDGNRVKHKDFWTEKEINYDRSSEELRELFTDKLFDFAKPLYLIKKLVSTIIESDKDSIILDFFSGSATTAHAVMQLNAEDGGNRKFIMVQIPEPCDEKTGTGRAAVKLLQSLNKPTNVSEIGKQRIRLAGDKIKAEIEAANAQRKLEADVLEVPDIGFRVFRTADTNIRWTHDALRNEEVKVDVYGALSDKEKLDFMPGYTDIDVVYEIMLRQRDIPLSSKVEKMNIGERTYIFADAYVVCLDETITEEMIGQLAGLDPAPIKYIFRDSAFNDDIALKDEAIRRLEAYVSRQNGEVKKAYTVEFI